MNVKGYFRLAVIGLLASVLGTSCRNRIMGSGPIVSQQINVEGFSKIDLCMDAEVNYIHDNFYSVEVKAQSNIIDKLNIHRKGEVLNIKFQNYIRIGRHDRIIINVHSPNFEGADVSGSGEINVSGNFTNPRVDIDISGSGRLVMDQVNSKSCNIDISGSGRVIGNGGSIEDLNTEISGSGRISFESVQSNDATTRTSGSGKTYVWANRNLDVKISGSGTVYYKGSPSIETSISGSGKVRKL